MSIAEDIEINIKSNIEGLDNIEALREHLNSIKEGGEEASEGVEKATSATDAFTNVASTLVSIGLADYFKSSAESFDNYNLSMSAMSTVAQQNGVSLQGVKDGVKAVTDATSISGGVARQFYTNMMNMGVTNTKALADTMIGLQGSTVITGQNFDSLKNRLIMMMNSTSLQSRALTSMGLSMEKLAQVNGMTVDQLKDSWATFTPDQKLAILNKGLEKNKGLTKELAQTSGDKLKEIENSWGALSVAIGSSTSGATNAIYDLTNNGIQGLTWAIETIPGMDALAGIGLGASSAIMGVMPLISTVNQLGKVYENTGKVIDKAKNALTEENLAEKLTIKSKLQKVKATLISSAATIRESLATAESTVSQKLQVVWNNLGTLGKQMYAIATGEATLMEYGFLAPILLIIGAIALLVGGLFLLGQYMGWWNDWGGFVNAFKAEIMQVWQAIVHFGQGVYSTLVRISAFSSSTFAKIVATARKVISQIGSFFRGLPGQVRSALSGLWGAITSPFQRAYSTIRGIVSNIKSSISGIAGSVGSVLGLASGFDLGINNSSNFTTGENLGNTVTTNANSNVVVNVNGIVENDAKEYIVNTISDRIQKENLIKGL